MLVDRKHELVKVEMGPLNQQKTLFDHWNIFCLQPRHLIKETTGKRIRETKQKVKGIDPNLENVSLRMAAIETTVETLEESFNAQRRRKLRYAGYIKNKEL